MRSIHGMSLMEVVIALGIFGMITIMALQISSGTNKVVDDLERRNDLETQAAQVTDSLINDLANTGWFFDWDDDNTDGVMEASEIDSAYPWVNPPMIKSGVTIANGDRNWASWSALSVTTAASITMGWTDTSVSPKRDYLTPRCDRLLFMRLQAANQLVTTADNNRPALINIDPRNSGGTRIDSGRGARMSQFPYASPVPGLILDTSAAGSTTTTFVNQRWESSTIRDYWDNLNPRKVRIYLYNVEPDPKSKFGLLVRRTADTTTTENPFNFSQFSSGTAKIIASNVVDFQVETFRSLSLDSQASNDKWLNWNQVRFTIWIARTSPDGTDQVVRFVQVTSALRSITNPLTAVQSN